MRRHTAERVTAALEPGLRTRAFVFNTLLADKMVDDRLRHHDHWLQSRNLSNEASDESVQALVEAVRGRYELPRRWYRLKARLLGIDRLADYDRMASVVDEDEPITWSAARDMVLDAYGSFSGELGDLARRFFDEGWIDAPVRPGKRGGAFCAYTVLRAPVRDAQLDLTPARRAHAGARARPRGARRARRAPGRLSPVDAADARRDGIGVRRDARVRPPARAGAERRLAPPLLAESIEGSIATVFRQVAMNRFEDLVHTERRGTGELSVERFGALWRESQEELLGDAVEVTEGYTSWWSYVPHFINTPGYVYAYAYGQPLALSVYGRCEAEGPAFVPAYLDLLGAGGRGRRRSSGASSASTWRTRASGTPGSTWSSASSPTPRRRRARPGGLELSSPLNCGIEGEGASRVLPICARAADRADLAATAELVAQVAVRSTRRSAARRGR